MYPRQSGSLESRNFSSARNGGECRAVIPVFAIYTKNCSALPDTGGSSSDEYLAEICLEIFFFCAERPNGADNFCKFLARHA